MAKDGESRWSEIDDTIYRIITGNIHAESCAPISEKKIRKNRYKPIESAEAAAICLTCTEPACRGSEICFERRKKELKEKGEIK